MPTLRGIVAAAFIAVNTVVLASLLAVVALVRRLVPGDSRRDRITYFMDRFIDRWVENNRFMLRALRLTQVNVSWRCDAPLSRDQWYLVVANHQGWSDILILQEVLLGRIPPLKFFVKRALVWLPFVGAGMWVLDFPFLRRYNAEQVAKNPELAAVDRAETEAACARFKRLPTSLLIFVEGTRFTAEKHAIQGSPYTNLLKPKIGGVSYVLDGLGERISQVIDVTLLYPDGTPSFWGFLCGRCPRVEVDVHALAVPTRLITEAAVQTREEGRDALQRWVGRLWLAKDTLMTDRRAS